MVVSKRISSIDSATLREIVGLMLQKRFPGHIVYPIYQPNFEKQLLTLEIKHPQQKTTLKIALLYSNGTETTLQDFFNHSMFTDRRVPPSVPFRNPFCALFSLKNEVDKLSKLACSKEKGATQSHSALV